MAVREVFRHGSGLVSLIILAIVIGGVVLAPWLTPHDPFETTDKWLSPPSPEHLLGTDDIGRDILARILYGGRNSLFIGFAAVAIGLTGGGAMGLAAGFWGGAVDKVLSRITEVMMAFPNILLALAIAAVLGPSLINLTVALGIAAMPMYMRVVRGAVLSAMQHDYVEAARALGGQRRTIVARHLLPNVMAPIIVLTTTGLAGAILTAAGLSFIGLGPPAPEPEWGGMLAAARGNIHSAWWFITFPGLAISMTVTAINLLGDALRDVLDPGLKV